MGNICNHEYNLEQKKCLLKAKQVSYLSLVLTIINCVVLYFIMGHSQALWTNFVENVFNILPPVIFLAGNYICTMKKNKHYPYGYNKVITLAFFTASIILLILGIYLLYDSLQVLIHREYPTIGLMNLFGFDIWAGWLMIAFLSINVPFVVLLSNLKLKLAVPLHDKIIYTDALMNKADWLTNGVAILGVVGIGFGIWWADAIAATFISLDILFDGCKQFKDSLTGMIDRAPTDLKGKYLPLPNKIKRFLLDYPKITKAEICLRETGHVICGEAFVQLKKEQHLTPHEIGELCAQMRAMDWRLCNIFIVVMDDS